MPRTPTVSLHSASRSAGEVFQGFSPQVFTGLQSRMAASGAAPVSAGKVTRGNGQVEARGRSYPQRLAFHHRPGSVVLLDDVPEYLDMLADGLGRYWNVKTFGSGADCINFLQQEPPRWEADFWAQQQILEKWHGGQRLIPQILKYWADSLDRYELTKVCVVDYLMPGMDGMEVLDELRGWPGYRVMLTGAFDNALAIEAFNSGLIDQFLLKHSVEFTQHLQDIVTALMARPNPRFHQIWSDTLTLEQNQLLCDTDIANSLSDLVSRTFVEWIVIGDPFGVLGVDAAGKISWIQLEPTHQLGLLADMAAECGASGDDVAQIQAGKALSDVQLLRNLGIKSTPTNVPSFSVGAHGLLLSAIHRVACPVAPGGMNYRNRLVSTNRPSAHCGP